MSDLSNRVILTVAPTGSSTPAAKCPGLPVTPAEIAAETYECWKAGASVVHLHVRDDQGNASMEYEKFRESVALIREKCDIVINMTTAGGFGVPDDERILPLDLIPEMATMDAGSMNVKGDFVFHNSVAFLEKLGRRAQELGIRPEIEVMDTGMVYTALRLIEQGYIKSPPHFQMVLGMENGMAATVENLVYMKNLLPPGATWRQGPSDHSDGHPGLGRPRTGGDGGQYLSGRRTEGQLQCGFCGADPPDHRAEQQAPGHPGGDPGHAGPAEPSGLYGLRAPVQRPPRPVRLR